MSITHIYNKDLKKIISLNYSLDTFKKQPNLCYPDWTSDMIATEKHFSNPKIVDGTLEEKTRVDLVNEGLEELRLGEVIQGDEIIYIPCPAGLFKPKWVSPKWVEGSTDEEIEEHNFKEFVRFYNEELEFASKATAELACEIISQDDFESVKEYMRAIDPYKQSMKAFSLPTRPLIFDKYTK